MTTTKATKLKKCILMKVKLLYSRLYFVKFLVNGGFYFNAEM